MERHHTEVVDAQATVDQKEVRDPVKMCRAISMNAIAQ